MREKRPIEVTEAAPVENEAASAEAIVETTPTVKQNTESEDAVEKLMTGVNLIAGIALGIIEILLIMWLIKKLRAYKKA